MPKINKENKSVHNSDTSHSGLLRAEAFSQLARNSKNTQRLTLDEFDVCSRPETSVGRSIAILQKQNWQLPVVERQATSRVPGSVWDRSFRRRKYLKEENVQS